MAKAKQKTSRQTVDKRDKSIDKVAVDPFADGFSFVAGADGTCVLHPRMPQLAGTRPWDWCIEEDRERCREAFVEACMFRQECPAFEARVRFEGRIIRLAFRLFPLDTGQVLCQFRRVFEDELSLRERHVLSLLAGGANSAEIAKALGITASTARDHMANIKKKLNIRHREGFRMAAYYFGIHGGSTEM